MGFTQGFRVIPEVTPKWVNNTNVHSKFTLISLFSKIHSLKSEHIHSFLFREYTPYEAQTPPKNTFFFFFSLIACYCWWCTRIPLPRRWKTNKIILLWGRKKSVRVLPPPPSPPPPPPLSDLFRTDAASRPACNIFKHSSWRKKNPAYTPAPRNCHEVATSHSILRKLSFVAVTGHLYVQVWPWH